MGLDDPTATKRCSGCGEVRLRTEFNKLKKAKDGRQWNCRACNKRYHYDNWDRHMGQIRARKRRIRRRNQQFVVDYLRRHPCVDCGETDIVVLEFDHVRGKTGNISTFIPVCELSTLENEIALCDVVCCNCHRRRTAARSDAWYRRDLGAATDHDGVG